ncbi:MAG: chemotaxis protein CheB [Spirochaetia bacterium]|jgi:two-component system chemotaxis response regulator CheB|nr:chemotaxis protein CheB [Spirochaetia bacterium]
MTTNIKEKKYEAVAIGVSAGGLKALIKVFSNLPADFPIPIIVTQHLNPSEDSYLAEILNRITLLPVKEAMDKEKIKPGNIYIAPPNYHLLLERNETISLSNDEKVNYSRPSIDAMFESAAYAWSGNLIGIILTGASIDGANGIRVIKNFGGLTIAEDPKAAEYPMMPKTAVDTGAVDKILTLSEINKFLINLSGVDKRAE